MRYGVIVLVIALLVLGFGRGDAPGRKLIFHLRNMECWRMPHDGGVAALGDSITAGTQDPELGLLGRSSWFAQAVCHDGVKYGYNAAIPNYTTEMVRGRLKAALDHHPKVVAVLTGTNDVLNNLSQAHAIGVIADITRRIRAAHAVPVFGTLPPFDASPSRAARFNVLLKRWAKKAHVRLIDFHSVLTKNGRYRPDLTDDGLHPNVAGARLMAKLAAPVLMSASNGRGRI